MNLSKLSKVKGNIIKYLRENIFNNFFSDLIKNFNFKK